MPKGQTVSYPVVSYDMIGLCVYLNCTLVLIVRDVPLGSGLFDLIGTVVEPAP